MDLPGQRAGWRVRAGMARPRRRADDIARRRLVTVAPADPPKQVHELIQLLRDPAVQAWLRNRRRRPAGACRSGARIHHRLPGGPADEIRRHLLTMIATVPKLPGEFARGPERSRRATCWNCALLVLAHRLCRPRPWRFVCGCSAAPLLGIRRWIDEQPIDTIGHAWCACWPLALR